MTEGRLITKAKVALPEALIVIVNNVRIFHSSNAKLEILDLFTQTELYRIIFISES